MRVFSYFDPDGPELDVQLVSLWADSWQAQGWTPRLLTIRDARKNPLFNESDSPALLAWENAGAGWYAPASVLNLSFKPKRLRISTEFFYGGVLWATRRGAREILTNPALGRHPGSNLVSAFGIDPSFPLVSFADCTTIDEVQHAIASLKCL